MNEDGEGKDKHVCMCCTRVFCVADGDCFLFLSPLLRSTPASRDVGCDQAGLDSSEVAVGHPFQRCGLKRKVTCHSKKY